MLPARGPPPGSGGGDRLRIFLQNRQPAAGEAQADNAAIAETMRPKQGERKSFDLQVERVQCSAMAGDKDVPIFRQLLKGIQKTSGAAPVSYTHLNNPMCPDARVFYLWRDNTAPCSTRRRQESTTPTARRKVRAMPEREETYKCGTTRPAADAWEMGQTGNRRIPARACGPGVQGRAGHSCLLYTSRCV